MSGHKVTISKQLPAPPEVVFDAWTKPEDMSQWFSPMTTASIPKLELREGGEYRIDMHGDPKDYIHTGKYIEIDRPRRLVFSWVSDGTEQRESIVTLEFKPHGGGTLLTLTHEKLPSEKSGKEHEQGWTAIMEKLAHRFTKQANA